MKPGTQPFNELPDCALRAWHEMRPQNLLPRPKARSYSPNKLRVLRRLGQEIRQLDKESGDEADEAAPNLVRQRYTATHAHMASTIPKGHAPCRNP
jgi:hypothetical protein